MTFVYALISVKSHIGTSLPAIDITDGCGISNEAQGYC